MDFLSKEHISGVSKHDRMFILKLIVGGILTAYGAYDLGFNLELSFAALVFVPALGMFFTYLKQEVDSNLLRWISLAIFAVTFGMLTGSWYLAVALLLLVDGATHRKSITRCDDAKWMRIVRAEASMDDLNRLITGHSLFQKLPKEVRLNLAEQSTVMEVEPGAALIRKGEFNYYLFLLAKGEASVIRKDEVVAELRSGDIFGEVSAVGLSLPVADVVAKSMVLAFAIPVDALWAVVSDHPDFASQLRDLGMTFADQQHQPEQHEQEETHELFDKSEAEIVSRVYQQIVKKQAAKDDSGEKR